jgi:hypothetical protein
MRTIPPALLLVLAAFTVPVAVEVPTVAGFFGVDLPFAATIVLEVLMLGALVVVYVLGETTPDPDPDADADGDADDRTSTP